MQYAAIILALAGAAYAQVPGIPACASGPVGEALAAIDGPSHIQDLCNNKDGVLTKLTSQLEAACSCADLNTAIGFAGQFCTNLHIPKKDCSATSSSAAPVTSSSASSAPVTASSTATITTSTSVTASYSSVSGKPTASTNGTITTSPPSSTTIVTGAGSAAQVGGIAMVGAFLAALAL